jgi:DNA-binding GntR family transcriptional regulator
MDGYISGLRNRRAHLKEIEDIYSIISLLEGYATELATYRNGEKKETEVHTYYL